jgi:hypothetical protein
MSLCRVFALSERARNIKQEMCKYLIDLPEKEEQRLMSR